MVSIRRKKIIRLLAIQSYLNCKMKKKRQSKYWVHPLNQQRQEKGEHLKLLEMYNKYPDRFCQYTRLSPVQFDKLLGLVGPSLRKQNTNWRNSVDIEIRLFVILRYLATGDSLPTIATNFCLGVATVWKIVRSGLPALWEHLKNLYVKCPSKDEWDKIGEDFNTKWNYPNCLGAVDGKHVVITAPANSGSLYHNYKGTFSIVLLATCDAAYKFTTVDVGGYGKQSDGGVFNCSVLGKKLNSGSLDIPKPAFLPNENTEIPYHFIGDEAFPLRIYMMRPYPGRKLKTEQRIYNYRLSRARRCIENAFGIMAARFRIFRRPIQATPKNAEQVVLAAVALHNFLLTEEATLQPTNRRYCPTGFADAADQNNGAWRTAQSSNGLLNAPILTFAAQERRSKLMRETLTDYFNGTGQVPWQNEKVGVVVDSV